LEDDEEDVEEVAVPQPADGGLNIILEESEFGADQTSRNQTRSTTQGDDQEEYEEEEEEEKECTHDGDEGEEEEHVQKEEPDEEEEEEQEETDQDEEEEEEEEESEAIEETIGELNVANNSSPGEDYVDQSPSVVQNETTESGSGGGFVNATYVVNPIVRRKSVKFDTAIDDTSNDDDKEDSDFYYKKTPYRPPAESRLAKRNSYQERDERPILSRHVNLDDSSEFTPPSVQFKSILRKSNSFNNAKGTYSIFVWTIFLETCSKQPKI
jgi:hypothetical protein